MFEILNFLGIQIILLFIVTSVHTYVGLHIIRRGIVFSDLVLDQLAAFGVIVGIGYGIQGGSAASYFVSFIAVLFGAALLAYFKPKNQQIPHEAIIGILYGLALGASLMVADKLTGGAAYVTETLEGCMLWVTWPLVWVTATTYVLLAILLYKIHKRIIAVTEGTSHSETDKHWDLVFFICQGIITVLIVPIAGVLLAYGFLMIPAATATLFTKDWGKGLQIGWLVGFTSSLAGLFASYFFRLPYGPTLVIALGICFAIGLFVRLMKPALN